MSDQEPNKDIQFKLRLPAELHEQLERAAAGSNRSLSSEIVERLKASFPETVEELLLRAQRQTIFTLDQKLHALHVASYRNRDTQTKEERAKADLEILELETTLSRLRHKLAREESGWLKKLND